MAKCIELRLQALDGSLLLAHRVRGARRDGGYANARHQGGTGKDCGEHATRSCHVIGLLHELRPFHEMAPSREIPVARDTYGISC